MSSCMLESGERSSNVTMNFLGFVQNHYLQRASSHLRPFNWNNRPPPCAVNGLNLHKYNNSNYATDTGKP